MDTIQLPTIALPTSYGGAAPALQPGQVIQALVLALLENGAYRLQLPNTVLDLRSEIALVPGSTVRLAVKGTPNNLKLVVLTDSAAPQASQARSAPNVPQGTPMPAADSARPVVSGRPAPAEAVIVDTGVALRRPEGLPSIEAPKLTPATPQASPRPPAPEQALATAVASAATRQGGLGPLLANIAHLLQDGAAPLPEPVRAAGAQLLALRLPLENLTAHDLRQAFARSGLVFEARLATTQPQAVAVSPGPAEPDLKAALLVFRHVLKTWSASEPVSAGPHALTPGPADAVGAAADWPRSRAGLSQLKDLLDVPDMEDATANLAKAVRAALEQGARPALDPSVHPPPPYRGAPTAAQPVAQASIVEDMAPRESAERLLVQTDAVLARQTLLQASSLPDRIEAGPRTDAAPRWNFEIPLAMPQGTGIVHFEINRDGHTAPTEAASGVWRARFSLDIEPDGPVHALVTLAGDRAGVTLWAERPATAARLSEGAPLLGEALRVAALEPGDLQFHLGVPRAARPARPGRFMDRAT